MDKDELLKALKALWDYIDNISDEVDDAKNSLSNLIDDVELYLVDAES